MGAEERWAGCEKRRGCGTGWRGALGWVWGVGVGGEEEGMARMLQLRTKRTDMDWHGGDRAAYA